MWIYISSCSQLAAITVVIREIRGARLDRSLQLSEYPVGGHHGGILRLLNQIFNKQRVLGHLICKPDKLMEYKVVTMRCLSRSACVAISFQSNHAARNQQMSSSCKAEGCPGGMRLFHLSNQLGANMPYFSMSNAKLTGILELPSMDSPNHRIAGCIMSREENADSQCIRCLAW